MTPSCSTTNDPTWLIPPPVRPGDVVRVIAPSSPFDPSHGWRGLRLLSDHFRVRFRPDAFARAGFLAGDDPRRAKELDEALGDRESSAIFCMRGGTGANRFVSAARWELLRAHPKWIVGFSDITALHMEAQRMRVASLHAGHIANVGASAGTELLCTLLEGVHDPCSPRRFSVKTWAAGEARGPLSGGNLTVLHNCAAAGTLKLPHGSVLFLEDVGERPYRIDRMLHALRVGGHLAGISGLVLGDFTDCVPGPDGQTVWDVLKGFSRSLGCPTAIGVPSGHAAKNAPLVLGAHATLDLGIEEGTFGFSLPTRSSAPDR